MGALLAVYGAWQLTGRPGGHHELVGDAFFVPAGIAAVWTALRAAARCEAHLRLRLAWRLIALASCLYMAGDVAQTVYEASGHLPYPSVADAFYLSFYPCLLWGLLCVPGVAATLRERLRLGLDLAVVAVAGAAVVIYVVLGPTVLAAGPDLQSAISVAYPVGDMVLLVGLGALVLRRHSGFSPRTLQLMAVGVVFFIAADLVYGWITLHATYHGGDPVDALWLIAVALFAVAGSAQEVPPPGRPPFAGAGTGAGTVLARATWAPYVAVAVGYGLLLFNERNDRLFPDGVVVLCAVVITALVSARQFLAQRDLVSIQGQLSHQSSHDPLTGLPNRSLVIDCAAQMLAGVRCTGQPIAALYVDIDGFKRVNDSFGHAAGDELLAAVSARLSEVIRESDVVGRIGGDEFVVLLANIRGDAIPDRIATRICESLARPVGLPSADGRRLAITASVGIAQRTEGTADDLLRDADFALYEAKRGGRNRWVRFASEMQDAAEDRLEIEADLREAIEQEQLFLLYQPLIDLSTETITGVEALIRWRHPERGLVSPGDFIEVAEASGLIVDIGRWVLRTGCRQAAAWQARGRRLGMAINVSAVQLDDSRLVGDVADALADSGLDPALLTLEITETTLMRDAEGAAALLRQLKALGVRISIDDFGTGYSSLAYLGQFPVDALKIDRSFVSRIAASSESRALIHALVQLAKALGLETVGEGIEDRDQLRYLQRERCESGQGFLFARPLETAAVDGLLGDGPTASEPTIASPAPGSPARPATPRSTAPRRPQPAESTTR
jgi:diguanylate cyclase (GGDEF)-like protein